MDELKFEIHKSLKFFNPILNMSANEDALVFADNAYGIFYYCIKDEKLIFGKRISKNKHNHHIYSKAISISNDKKILIPDVSSPSFRIYEIINDRLVAGKNIKWHKANISCTTFSSDFKFFATGGEDGRVFVYTTQDAKLYALCPTQADYIACMSFDSKNSLLVFGVYNNKILVFDLNTCNIILELETPSVCVDLCFFEEDRKIFYICKEGESGIIDLINQQNYIKKIYNVWLHHCVLSDNKRYAYIVGRDDILRIHCLEENEKVFEIRLPDNGVSFIRVFDRFICVCFISGKVIFIDKDYQQEHFHMLLKNKNYEEARIFAQEKNIFLKLDEKYMQVRDENWKDVLEDIVRLFANEQIENALYIAEPYLEDSKINREFKEYLNQKKILHEFLNAIENGLYYRAYQIAEEQKELKKVKAFEELEKYFEKILEVSKKMLEEDYGHQIYRVKKLLEPFILVPEKKERIDILFNHFDQYVSMLDHLKNHIYKEAFHIAEKYPYLKVTRAYMKIFNYYKEKLIFLQNEVLHQVQENIIQEQLRDLEEVELFKVEVEMIKNFYNAQEKMKKAFKHKDYNACYQILQNYPQLLASECYLEIENNFLTLFKKATDHAQSGNTAEVYEILSDFFVLGKWKNRLDIIFQISYFYEIKNVNTEEKNIDWIETLSKYIAYFDKSSELKELCMQKNLDRILDNISDIPRQKVEYKKTIIERLK